MLVMIFRAQTALSAAPVGWHQNPAAARRIVRLLCIERSFDTNGSDMRKIGEAGRGTVFTVSRM